RRHRKTPSVKAVVSSTVGGFLLSVNGISACQIRGFCSSRGVTDGIQLSSTFQSSAESPHVNGLQPRSLSARLPSDEHSPDVQLLYPPHPKARKLSQHRRLG